MSGPWLVIRGDVEIVAVPPDDEMSVIERLACLELDPEFCEAYAKACRGE